MSEEKVYPVPAEFARRAHIDEKKYRALYARSLADPDGFWAEQAQEFVTWFKPWKKVSDWSFDTRNLYIKWFEGARLNVAYNCLDRHLEQRGDQVAILWEGDDPKEDRKITYRELHAEVCRFANVLKGRGVKKGDRVCIYMPMIPETAVAMLACARIGAVHSVVFGGFSPESLKDRILDSDCRVVVTADEGVRAGRKVPLKTNTDTALTRCPDVHSVIVYRRTGGAVPWQDGRDYWYHELMGGVSADCPPAELDAEDPLFILYTSGSTGKPKGVLHTTGGYLVFVAATHKYVFDYHDGDIYWCTADVGWVTGHSYIVYGPLANGATTMMFEGVPNYPSPARFWDVVDKHKVNIFYTAPTAIRAFMKFGDELPNRHDMSSLRLLGTVGEPINPEAWMWFYNVIGRRRCPIVDTWWQTETGHILISPLPGVTTLKPGSATHPFPGLDFDIVNEKGESADAGFLVIKSPWPGMLRGIFRDPERYRQQYWSKYPGWYLTGDGAKRDKDGCFWLLGRVDDVMKVSGHRISTMEVESALVDHPSVAESAVIGKHHDVKEQAIVAFVTVKMGRKATPELAKELKDHVVKKIGSIARPDDILFTAELPKTRSGKIMRRLLRDIAEGRALGDTTTLADGNVVKSLKEKYESQEG